MEKILSDILSLDETKVEDKEVPFNLGFFDAYQFDSFMYSLDDRDDEEICKFIKSNIEYICKKTIENSWDNANVLLSEKFINNFIQVVSTLPITYTIRVASNKICYDYSLIPVEKGRTKEMMQKLLKLAKIVNYSVIQRLVGLGLPEGIAANLALCRYSSRKESTNIRRLNFVMCTKDPEIMDEQMIIYVYETFFDRVGELFKETMLEYYTPEQELDFGNDFCMVYSTVSLAILTIVNNMKMSDIDRLIRGYVSDWEYLGRPPVRFSLISLSADYSRIQTIVESMTREKIYVP
jgi:hypothetical protein